MGWGNIYRRRLKVFSVALLIYLDNKAVQQREKFTNESKRAALWEKFHERNAKRVHSLMVELEGLWVKLGQYLSTHPEVLPEAYVSLLKQLQDSVPPHPIKEVRQTIHKEFGKTMDDLFADFVEEPLATASIAQVHRATLIDGHKVVVKVQHDGIKEIILDDLKSAKSIVDWIAWVDPELDWSFLIDEWCKEVPKELDFNQEADYGACKWLMMHQSYLPTVLVMAAQGFSSMKVENTRIVFRNLGCKRLHDENKSSNQINVLIPEVIQSTNSVLILEYMDGIRLNDIASLEAFGVDKQKIVEEITRAYAHQIYVDGFFNGNFLVSKEAPHRPILLDFGLTKKLPSSVKQALAKMFLASAEGDHVALLSAFSEMGLKLRIDTPEKALEAMTGFFRSSTPVNESQIEAFPDHVIIFSRVIDLLRGLSSTMNTRIKYLKIMRPFAESVLLGGPAENAQWIYSTPIHSNVEAKLRQLLVELGNNDKILGIQVCAYKDGKVIIDTAAGVLGRCDPRPVQPDSLFSVFSVTKGITAGMLHWLVDNGKLKLEEYVGNIWPEFRENGKDHIKVHHVLSHTSGLHNALGDLTKENPLLYSNWEECLKRIAASVPETEPGKQQLYHYLSFGWLCGGIIERASGKKFQEILEEAFINPLKIEGELYIGIPPGVESRLASLTLDMDDLKKVTAICNLAEMPMPSSGFQLDKIGQLANLLPALFNMLNTRRAIIPAANGHCSARALARYYAALVDNGLVPPPHSSSSNPPLGSHPHIPKFGWTHKKHKGESTNVNEEDNTSANNDAHGPERIFCNPKIHDAFLGVGEYQSLSLGDGRIGLGFKRLKSKDGNLSGFGHSGMGGSTGFCDIKNRFAIAVTLNKLSFGGVTAKIIKLVCSELNIPLAEEESSSLSGPGEWGLDAITALTNQGR
ncbi:Beta-lactamase-related protein [Corchorus olitorius]|uniref:Beta-lactamase-related protein n=1 Tax=Corchorus olitorius TaxID=93759 RepID=A0A1R3J8G5_9ROSI|nr:Beta-lactamase-related protein [Corchorus olitorius]